MDCPEPINQETLSSKIKKSKKFNSKDAKGQNFEIEIALTNDSIIFKSEINNEVITKRYSSIYSFDKLKQNKLFSFLDNIEEIYEQLEVYIKDDQATSKLNENNFTITLITRVKKYPEITFDLKQEIMDNKQIINILIDKVAKLESKNKDLESEIKYLKAENEKIKINLSAINEFINEKKEKQRIKNLPFNDSSILLKKEEIKIVSDWIKPNTKIKTTLLYRVSRDGDGFFGARCINKGPIIIFVKSDNGFRFGSFSGNWNNQNGWVKDKDAFLFSLNNKLKFMNNNTNYTVYHGNIPDFGDSSYNELIISSTCLTKKYNYLDDRGSAFSFKIKDLIGVDAQGQYNFNIQDYEVYSVLIEN